MKFIIHPTPVHGGLIAPPSKSYTQRALVAALLAKGKTIITNASVCDDAIASRESIQIMGAEISDTAGTLEITSNGIAPTANSISCGESGLASRLFTCIAALTDKEITIGGSGSLLNRPTMIFEKVLQSFGAQIKSSAGRFPVTVKGPMHSGNITIDGASGSQFLSGLLMALPTLQGDSLINVDNPVSTPYINMTLEVLEHFGIHIEANGFSSFAIKGSQQYQPCNYVVEGDWSGASFMLVAGALNGEVTVSGLNMHSKQADHAILEALKHSGATVVEHENSVTVKKGEHKPFIFDATNCPDLFPPLVALASACDKPSIIKGISRLKYKESNRINSLMSVFSRLGNVIKTEGDEMLVTSEPHFRSVSVDPFGDHRIAMAAAIAALRMNAPVIIDNAECVDKSYPGFFRELFKIYR
jgi:3-phosphoshikimate 1-carboxyvinyltransferase